MKNKKLIFSVLFTGILFLNTFFLTGINESKLQLNSLFTLATAQYENVENVECGDGLGDKVIVENITFYKQESRVEHQGSRSRTVTETTLTVDIDCLDGGFDNCTPGTLSRKEVFCTPWS
ncbi:MAG: hypothetical protein JXR50_02905 [Prolixibacteraceae bacterium]|nr:hypothetical protein [Prolixibacteraceae bacterium]